jgi:hypothetical protein
MNWIRFILIALIIIVVLKIFLVYNQSSSCNPETYINITNPFVDGLSQAQLGATMPDYNQILGPNTLPVSNSNNVINSSDPIRELNMHNYQMYDNSSLNTDIELIKNMKKNKRKYGKYGKYGNNSKSKQPQSTPIPQIPCKKLNKFFVESQFNDAYRDVLTAFNYICPDQKAFFNLQSLPVTTTIYNPKATNPYPPFQFIKLVTQFLNSLNKQIKELPENAEIINNYNNYLPLTSQASKYVQDKGINKFYKEIGVDYNLYADTPPNSPVELIDIIGMTREYTEAQTKYIVSFVIKKILKSIDDQLKITVHFVTKNDIAECVNMWTKDCAITQPQGINTTQQVAIEYIFTDGYYTNSFNYDYDCANQPSKKVSNIDNDDNYYSFSSLGECNIMQDHEIIKEFNKKQREHDLEMNNFNVNVPYPVYATADSREAVLSGYDFPKPLYFKEDS